MARVKITHVVQKISDNTAATAQVSVRQRGQTTGGPQLYNQSGGTIGSPGDAITTVGGRIEAWVDEGSYDLVVSGDGFTTYTQEYEAVSGKHQVINSDIADNAVTASKIVSGAITSAKVATDAINSANIGIGQVGSRAFKPEMGMVRQNGNVFPAVGGAKNDVAGTTLTLTPGYTSTCMINAHFQFLVAQGTTANSFAEGSGFLVVNGVVDPQQVSTYVYEGTTPYNISAMVSTSQTWFVPLSVGTTYTIKLQIANTGNGTGHSIQTYTGYCKYWWLLVAA